MTLYWWMHWFWITALNALLYAHCSFSQTVPTVQNGHQNGPYSETASSADRGQHSRENQQGVNLQNSTVNSTDRSKTQNEQLQTNISLSSELHQYSGPTAATENADGDHTLPSVLNLPVDLLHLEAKVKTHDYSQFPQVNGHESYEQNWDHFAAPQWDTSSVPYKEEQDNITSSVVSANPVSDDEPMKGNISKSQSSIHEMNASEDQPVNDAPQSDAMDVFNMSDGITANVKKTPAVANSTTDGSPVNKPAGYNYRGKYVNMEKKMQEKPRNMTSLKLKTGSTPIVYVTPTSMKIVTEVMRESEEENVTESTNHVGGMILSKDNISITLPMDESVASVTADPNIRNLATIENHTNNDSVLNAVSRERIGQSNDTQGLDAASITGIALGILASAVLVGAVSVILYRRRYLNKPQTLNDSNPDSSGYLDENTLRENSEEMYSLDNDSFLNSLEAMTIQNYWTDSVKHTKL